MSSVVKEIVALLHQEYGEMRWRPHGDAMTELVLTILSQNTSDANSGRAFVKLSATFPSWEALMLAPAGGIADCIRSGGLAEVKAPRIKALLAEIWRRRNSFELSFLSDLPLAEAKAWLRSLPGVGPKTASCVLMFALGRPALPVDTHVHRVAGRLGLLGPEAGAEAAHEILEKMVEPEETYPLHIGLIDHGRRICHARRPLCLRCALVAICPSAPLFTGGG